MVSLPASLCGVLVAALWRFRVRMLTVLGWACYLTAVVFLVAVEIVLSVVAVGAAALIGRTLVERSLRPLNRVAATAQQVSQLPLDRGEVALAVRVPPADTESAVKRVPPSTKAPPASRPTM